MNYTISETTTKNDFTLLNYLPDIGVVNVKEEIIQGLKSSPKYISPKFFYDKLGSELFEEITDLEEYYPTKTEKSILSRIGENLDIDFENLNIVELGSGDASKIRLLFQQIPVNLLETVHYFPVDISESAIEKSITELNGEFQLNGITGIVADFIHQLDKIPKRGNRLFCFFGSTIGNLNANERQEFISSLGKGMQVGDSFLLGMDMVKSVSVLEDAYNDSKGVTAKFNKNILNVINHLSGANFDTSDFLHHAFYNQEKSRIEMHLKALADIDISLDLGEKNIQLKKGETIHTENSHKFTSEDILTHAKWGGMNLEQVFTDDNKLFSLIHFTKK